MTDPNIYRDAPARQEKLDALSAAASRLNAARTDRDTLVLEARRAGIPIRLVAIYAEVSPQTVSNIVTRHEGGTR